MDPTLMQQNVDGSFKNLLLKYYLSQPNFAKKTHTGAN